MLKKIFFTLLVILAMQTLSSAPYHGDIFEFKQPDGSVVEVRLYGDEYYARCEGLDGYTLIRDEKTDWICYAKLSDDGTQFVSTGIRYTSTQNNISTLKSAIGVEKGIKLKQEAVHQLRRSNQELLGHDKSGNLKSGSLKSSTAESRYWGCTTAIVGDVVGLTILVDFSDAPAPTSDISVYEEMLNGDNFSTDGNNGSVKQFYSDVSNGQLNFTNKVFGFFRASKTFAEYDKMTVGVGAASILAEALEWVDAQGFDFSTLSTEADSTIMAINLMYTGAPKNWAKGMWYHMGGYDGFTADGVSSYKYSAVSAKFPLQIGTVCHENGHMLFWWPDTYHYDGSNEGLGSWDLMCRSRGPNPPPPNPYFRSLASWDTQIPITSTDAELTSEANDINIYKYVNPNDSKEFYLIENRLKEGRNRGIPGEGLTIWHIDENKKLQSATSIDEQVVVLEHAYGKANNSTLYMAPFSGNYVDEFSTKTFPSSSWSNGSESGLRVYDISPIGQTVNFKVSFEESDMLKKEYMTIVDAQYESADYSIERILDKTAYSAFIGTASPSAPLEAVIDLGAEYDLTRLKYLSKRTSGEDAIKKYDIYVANDTTNWGDAVSSGNWVQNDTLKTAEFTATGRYLKLVALSNESASQQINCAEIYVHGTLSATSLPSKALVVSPQNNSGLQPENGTLEWEPGDGATNHIVYFSDDATIDENDLVSSQTATTYNYSNLQSASTYYWRVDEENANGVTTGDVWSFSTVTDVISTNKPIESSSDLNSTYTANKANDGNLTDNSSRWLSATGRAYPFWLEIDLEDIYSINGVRILTGWNTYSQPINDFQFQYWKDGAWVNTLEVTDNTDPAKYWGFESVNATKVRLNITKSTENRTKVFEVEVYGKYISDCNGDVDGTAYIDECDVCVEGNTGLTDCTTTDVSDINKPDIYIYPNPASKVLNISGINDLSNIQIVDILGQQYYCEFSGNQINISVLKKGLYFIKINHQTFKFYKE